ncbi:uncharacterized protein LOC134722713 [Mytilus trossulus]|uniref:uncharacterized protein LOC134722713 n=1 Tax=Mytilus trossulus TaxID=6551 RepID=UPI003006F3D3
MAKRNKTRIKPNKRRHNVKRKFSIKLQCIQKRQRDPWRGVFVLVEKSITSVEQTSLITDGEIEWVKIKIKNNEDLLVGSFYMPHRDQKHLNELQKSLEKARTNGNTNVILSGDFNCPDIIWETATTLGPDREIQQGLDDIAETYNLTQIHTMPTREGNLLDLVFVTNPTLVKSLNNVPGISDHDIIIPDLETKVHHQKNLPRKCYIYKKAKWDQISIDLKHTLEEIKEKHHQGAEVHQLWDTFKSQLQKTMNTNIPNKEIRSRNNIPWIKHKQRKLLKKKQRLYKQARKTNKRSNYRSFQKECTKQLRKAEYEYVNQIIFEGLNNNDTKPFWKYIKSKRQDSGGIAPLKRETSLVSDSKGKAELPLEQFKSVFKITTDTNLPTTKIRAKINITPLTIDQKGLEKLLKNTNPNKASGPDNIPNRILKECAEQLAPILQIIMQCSLDTGELPKRLERREHIQYLQKRRQTSSRKLQTCIINICHQQNFRTHRMQAHPKTSEKKTKS